MSARISSERESLIIKAYKDGVMVKEIVSRFSVSPETVRRVVGTAGIGRGNAQPSDWSDERIERLKKLWGEGLSASQIASELGGVTRNGVIGKVHRLGLSGRIDPARQPRSLKAKPSAIPPLKPVAKKLRGDGFATSIIPHRAVTVDPGPEEVAKYVPAEEVIAPMSRRISIMELSPGFCRWPLGDPRHSDFAFCGGDCDANRPYCTAHANVAFAAGADRKAAINSMARAWPR